ncbi:type II toxin-antitoxin system PemK/MazF family toxin [Streptomyces sp. 7-21]|uniref:type II toxin-antitoxin system PemK/MazF family toxin n=1 Tax=Streptomyces sp. 7-21 TaxID=2802283 RepID=UPI0035A98BC6
MTTDMTMGEDVPGRSGAGATVEVHPRALDRARAVYAPAFDGDPDPGEIVWTWVPYEENDGRGKDRPVLVIAREENAQTLLAVQLTSRDRSHDREWMPLGTGPWDREARESWVHLERVLRVHPSGMRREACALDRARYNRVVDALRLRHGWR